MKNQQADTPGSDIQARRELLNDLLLMEAENELKDSAEEAECKFYEI